MLLAVELGQLGASRRLARTLQTGHQQDGRPVLREVDALCAATQQLDELLVKGTDELLAGIDACQRFLTDHARTHALDEVANYLVVDVGLQQGLTHLP